MNRPFLQNVFRRIAATLQHRSVKAIVRSVTVVGVSFATLLFFYLFFLFGVPLLQEISIGKAKSPTAISTDTETLRIINNTQRELQQLQRRYTALTPARNYLVVNTTENRFRVYRGRELLREGDCSTGSYMRLETDDRYWVFKTPKGRFSIKGKIGSPVWRKPDWAFIEAGLPVPPPGHSSRFEAGVLGDYALSLGGGYLIHGTIFQRYLGLPVTHGCIRLNDEDLEFVYHALDVGSRVFIY